MAAVAAPFENGNDLLKVANRLRILRAKFWSRQKAERNGKNGYQAVRKMALEAHSFSSARFRRPQSGDSSLRLTATSCEHRLRSSPRYFHFVILAVSIQ